MGPSEPKSPWTLVSVENITISLHYITHNYPLSQKTAMVMPRLEKSGLDPAEIKNYRPISNLPFMSKVIEKLILTQLTRYLTANGLFPKFQSGFRRHHSTETAILRVLFDIDSAIDQDQVSLLALLDVSVAFDTVDHGILLSASLYFIRTLRYGVHMVGVLHHWPSTDHSCWQLPFTSLQGSLWRSSGISVRTGFICPSTHRM